MKFDVETKTDALKDFENGSESLHRKTNSQQEKLSLFRQTITSDVHNAPESNNYKTKVDERNSD